MTDRDLIAEVAAERAAEREMLMKNTIAEKLQQAEDFLSHSAAERAVITFKYNIRNAEAEFAAIFIGGHWHTTGSLLGARYNTEKMAELFVRKDVDLTSVEVLRGGTVAS
jgi:hypothetical protein